MLAEYADRLFAEMIEDVTTDVALTAHQEILKSKKICPICLTYCHQIHVPLSARNAGLSRAASPAPVELSRTNSNTSQSGTATPSSGLRPEGNLYYDCLNCGRPFASIRYAPHLSSCLGIGSSRRNTSRSSTAKPKSNTESRRSATPSDRASPSKDIGEDPNSFSVTAPDEASLDSRKRKYDTARSNTSPYHSKVPSKLRETAFNSSPDGSLHSSGESSPVLHLQKQPSSPSLAEKTELAAKKARLSGEISRAESVEQGKPLPLSVAALRQRANSSSVDYILDGDEVSADSSSSDES